MRGKQTLNKTQRRQVINNVFKLVKNGASITDARRIISEEVDHSVNTLSTWQNKLGMKTPTITHLTNVENNTVSTRQKVMKTKTGRVNWRGNLGTVFSSLISKNGEYTNQDASAISQIANAALGQAKYDLEIHKLAEVTTNKRDKSLDHLLV